jgi:hypothetical protein
MTKTTALMALLLPVLLVFVGCDEENDNTLPSGWEDSTQAPLVMGACTDEDPTADFEDEIKAGLVNNRLQLHYRGVFACLDLAEARIRERSGGYDVLIHLIGPGGFACGNCVYDVRGDIGPASVGTEVSVYRTGFNEEEPELAGMATVESEDGHCGDWEACGVDNPCENEGWESDELVSYTWGCIQIDSCDGSFCVWDGEACMIGCGAAECNLLESYPAQISCNNQL